jgi:hypothetical protein
MASQQLPRAQAEVIWAAVTKNTVCYDWTDSAGTMFLEKY